MRGVKRSNLEGLRKRIATLFLQYIKTPAFNPQVSKFLRVCGKSNIVVETSFFESRQRSEEGQVWVKTKSTCSHVHDIKQYLGPHVQVQGYIVMVWILESESKIIFYGPAYWVQVQNHIFIVLVLELESKTILLWCWSWSSSLNPRWYFQCLGPWVES